MQVIIVNASTIPAGQMVVQAPVSSKVTDSITKVRQGTITACYIPGKHNPKSITFAFWAKRQHESAERTKDVSMLLT